MAAPPDPVFFSSTSQLLLAVAAAMLQSTATRRLEGTRDVTSIAIFFVVFLSRINAMRLKTAEQGPLARS